MAVYGKTSGDPSDGPHIHGGAGKRSGAAISAAAGGLTNDAITRRQAAKNTATPKVACSKCDRTGRLRVSRLIEGHGAELRLPVLKPILAGDYQRLNPRSIYDRLRGH